MLLAQRAYGPDGAAQWSGEDIALGRCLYRTLPEDEFDRQPLVGAGGRLVLVADVRLDNRNELLSSLGRLDTGLSDADVLLLALERWEEKALDRLNGDFAFALWDSERCRLLLARDPTGERPLYFHAGSGFFAFASMPRGLHAAGIPRQPDEDRLIEFVALIPEMGRGSYFKGIEQLAPGHSLTVSDGRLATRRYWNPEPRSLRLRSFEEYRDAFRHELDRSVRACLRGAEVRVATHLSSGWDSSAVTATAARLIGASGGQVVAFTAVPRRGNTSGAPFRRIANEGPMAASTAELYPNVEHRLVEGSAASPFADLDRYHEVFDRPLYNLCNFVWLTEIRRRAADAETPILLTGEIGNFSISASPPTLLADLVSQGRWRDWGREARCLARNKGARYRGILANSFGPWVPRPFWNMVRPLSSRPEVEVYTAIHPRLRKQVESTRERMNVGLARRPKDNFTQTLQALQHYDKGTYRKGTLGGWGIDERDPTANRALLEFCLSLPVEMLLKDGVRRPLARAALEDRLPRTVLDERRKGYQAADWHEGVAGHLDEAAALLDEIEQNALAAALLDVNALRTWIHEFPSEGWERGDVMARYRAALLYGLSAGHFILRASR
jgi:asparagine synthase (glutamine-hydrolysing)